MQAEVNLKGSLAETGYFDYAIAKADMKHYILLAGTYVHKREDVSTDAVTAEALATITFSYRKGQKEAGTIDITSHATRCDKSIQNLQVHADKASEPGDVLQEFRNVCSRKGVIIVAASLEGGQTGQAR